MGKHLGAGAVLLMLSVLFAPASSQPVQITGGMPTKFALIGKPLQGLLDEGYEITGISSGLAGFVYTLRKDRSWALCLFSMSGNETENTASSECRSLN